MKKFWIFFFCLLLCGCATVPAEPAGSCTVSIDCSTIFQHLEQLKSGKEELLPADGVILPPTQWQFTKGQTAYDALSQLCQDHRIHLETDWTPIYRSAYIAGIQNLYEFDCGPHSGWTYLVNGQSPGYGCSSYTLQDGDIIQWRYTCDLGQDTGAGLSKETTP